MDNKTSKDPNVGVPLDNFDEDQEQNHNDDSQSSVPDNLQQYKGDEDDPDEDENSTEGYLILTFSDPKKARVKAAAFADVAEAGVPDSDSYLEDGEGESPEESELPSGTYGEAFWVGEEEGAADLEMRPNKEDSSDPAGGSSLLRNIPTASSSSTSSRGRVRMRVNLSGLSDRSRKQMTGFLQHDPMSGDFGRKMLRCDQCGKYYRNEYSLKHHICLPRKDVWKRGDVPSEVIDGKLIYFCPTCNKPFKWLGNLTRHYYVHTGQRFFKCEVCDKEFFSAYQVKRHMNSHTGLRFKCEVCDKPFTCKYACAWHTRQHYTYVE